MANRTFKLPTFDKLPILQIPGIDLTNLDVKKNLETARDNTKRTVELATNLTKDVAYVTVGSGVLAFQQLQVRRRELTATLQARIPSSFGDVTAAGAAVSARATAVANSAKEAAEKVVSQGTKSVADVVETARAKFRAPATA